MGQARLTVTPRSFRLLQPFRFKVISKYLKVDAPKVLDAGCGGGSPARTKNVFPRAEYHGIDIASAPSPGTPDHSALDRFFHLDLTQLCFSEIPNAYYDLLIMSHVIEHLPNGDEVIRGLIPKLKPGGVIYIEFPGERSTRLPSMRGTLNFYDDGSHCRVFSVPEVKGLLEGTGVTPLRGGVRRDLVRVAVTPLAAIHSRLRHGFVAGFTFWDLLGFAEYVVGRRGSA